MKGKGFSMSKEERKELGTKMLILKESHFIQQYDLVAGKLGIENEEAREEMKCFISIFLSVKPEASFEDFMDALEQFFQEVGGGERPVARNTREDEIRSRR